MGEFVWSVGQVEIETIFHAYKNCKQFEKIRIDSRKSGQSLHAKSIRTPVWFSNNINAYIQRKL